MPDLVATVAFESISAAGLDLRFFRLAEVAFASSSMAGATLSGWERRGLADVGTSSAATVRLTGGAKIGTANPVISSEATVRLTGGAKIGTANPVISAAATCNLTGASDSHGVTISAVVQEALMLWGITKVSSAPDFVLARAMNDLNAAMQIVWNRASDRTYWSGNTLEITIASGDSHPLDDAIQNVIGPCRVKSSKRPLVPLGTIGELETFEDLYLDGCTSDEPLAYHIERVTQVGNDPAQCIFRVAPAVTAATTFLLEVVYEAPRYTTHDLVADPVIPIPHRYVESLLLPVVRYRASTYGLLSVPADQLPGIQREYLEACHELGLADPLPGKGGDNIESRKEQKP